MEKPERIENLSGTRPLKARFRCSCGEVFVAYASNVNSGKTKSCGCLRRRMAVEKMHGALDAFSKGNVTHGLFDSRTYQSFNSMMQRCTNPKRHNYSYYGGRGISVCMEWAGNYEQFVRDMGHRPHGTTLDRIDNEGNYSPENCRWADKKVQANNRRPRGKHSAS